ncbi:NUDIX hydrolase [Puteibacter caeruleilacunae]|nr:NUDIX hydrolase [Puteibacter caeruleilacunae]
MNFKNIPNTKHTTAEGKDIWNSRSVAVNGVIICRYKDELYVATSTRGENAADFQNHQNLVAGYLDWNETATEAFIRETWEEIGLNLDDLLSNYKIIHEDIHRPWEVNSDVTNNRQNVSVRFGLLFEINSADDFPVLTTVNNEIEYETVDPTWTPIKKLSDYPDWAFGHDKIILSYVNHLIALNKVKSGK